MSKTYFPQAVHDFRKANAVDTVYNTEGPSLTRQEFAEECDINTLMKRYEGAVIGGPGNLAPAAPMYVDFTQVPTTLMEYMQVMDSAQNAFMTLPAAVRREFDNDPRMFVDFASDEANLPQMRAWGLAEPEKVKEEPPPVKPASGQAEGSAPPAAAGGASTHGST